MPAAGELKTAEEASQDEGSGGVLDSLAASGTPIGGFLQKMITVVSSKLKEVKRGNPDKPIVLVGWGVGAAINCHVASMEASGYTIPNISALICLGFPMHTLDGTRGEADDPVLDLRVPTLFVIGQNATQSRADDVEDMRERLQGETGLVIVGGADDLLRVSKHKKKLEAIFIYISIFIYNFHFIYRK